MEVRKGYKQTEVGIIPEDWDVKQIQEVCGFIVPGRNKPKLFDGDIPWITTPDLEDGRMIYASRSSLRVSKREADAVGSRVVPTGSVLMSCVGELGIVAITGCDIVINQQLHAFLPSEAINRVFLSYAIKTRVNYLDSVATKTTIPYLNKDNCNSIPIPLPPLAEQEAIAEALSDADTLIEAVEQLLAKKRQVKQGAMQELITGKRRLSGFSGEWKTTKLGEFAKINKGQLITEKTITPGNIPVIAGGKEPAYYHNKPNRKGKTITISASGANAGYVAFYDKPIFASDCSTIEEDLHYSIGFIYQLLLLNQQKIYNAQTGGAQPHIHAKDLKPLEIMIPSKEEQTAIAEILSDMDAEISALEGKLVKARQVKAGMMSMLLTGKIRLV